MGSSFARPLRQEQPPETTLSGSGRTAIARLLSTSASTSIPQNTWQNLPKVLRVSIKVRETGP